MLKETDLVVWDFDGVVGANYDHDGMFWRRTVKDDLHPDFDIEKFCHRIFVEIGFYSFANGDLDLAHEAEKILPACGFDGTGEEFLEIWFSHDFKPIEGALDLVREVRALGIPCVMGTNNERHRLKRILGEWGFDGEFDTVYAAGLLGFKKPDHAFYDHITKDQNIADASRVLFIDDYPAYVEGASSYGWTALQHGDAENFVPGQTKDLRVKLGL